MGQDKFLVTKIVLFHFSLVLLLITLAPILCWESGTSFASFFGVDFFTRKGVRQRYHVLFVSYI
jgi:hypothetical protein